MTLTAAQREALVPFAHQVILTKAEKIARLAAYRSRGGVGADRDLQWLQKDQDELLAFVANPAVAPIDWPLLDTEIRELIRETCSAKVQELLKGTCPVMGPELRDYSPLYHCPVEPHTDADRTPCPVYEARAEDARLGRLASAIEAHVEEVRDDDA